MVSEGCLQGVQRVSRRCLECALAPTVFGPKTIQVKKILDPTYLLTQKFFEIKMFDIFFRAIVLMKFMKNI